MAPGRSPLLILSHNGTAQNTQHAFRNDNIYINDYQYLLTIWGSFRI